MTVRRPNCVTCYVRPREPQSPRCAVCGPERLTAAKPMGITMPPLPPETSFWTTEEQENE